ncbi:MULTISPECIES: MvdC family ATP-grasp ribosomal peptide maturase [Cyanophyceae]|uniref:MvdC family ATP-grasp ribosomal peptide maturase n=1 Tax=Nodularia spumigena CENA596 TaxID=1819295 RepID=A0A166I3A5_NODSP|nr:MULTISPECIES: MvdC family ATP-grasp ribosomal peptide maturase [Cyanophyceae]MDB9357907.1 MvdC family ATP-grasp ribosomal peptide maturase [Nodularia spumigena CS-587/03]KZL47811.1 MvdC family ATP-grasp ribosomal peptide maturase [Nodularia spumigena CENA596]MDB9304087.1 MvdC family ATP-grasp ribosomal peptide maturase [Nodularia spumigena CS-591/12]MDB9319499.1 MvdC family ATP-grasp ribosomal peptide maturase [Nodularia spumigena CS-590/01A]MDB9323104.1 MvdC family ATP-grasp ribosomal pept
MHLSRDIVLLITHSGDFFTIDRVAEALSKKGVQPFRLDTDRFPLEVQLTAHFDNNKSYHTIDYGGYSISTEQVQAVWLRRIWEPKLSADLDPKFREACIRESQATLNGFWDSLGKLHWVDKLERINAANDKLSQLRVATEAGFIIPQTLVTNKAEAAREFFNQVNGKMVSKLLTPLSRTMEYTSFFFYTSVVKEEDLQDAESLRYCPMVFQEQIPKQLELRVVYVNGKVFVGALDASVYETSKVDWRKPGVDVGVWQQYELPEQVLRPLQIFMDKLGLLFGALDFIVTPSGDYVFLEINPIGEWGMLEKDLDLPIANAIADTLLL